MTVATYRPGEVSVSMTNAAQAQARKEILSEGARGLRLSVKPSGCSGFKYVLDFVHEPATNDRAIHVSDDITVFVDEESIPIVNGVEMDYVTEGVNSTFRFRNPNATGECGCGESFTVNT